MTGSEFIKSVEELGFVVENDDEVLCVISETHGTVAWVRVFEECVMDNLDGHFYKLEKHQRKLFELLVEYASTPLKERLEVSQ